MSKPSMSGKRIYISPPCVAGDELDMVREAIESRSIARSGRTLMPSRRNSPQGLESAGPAALASGTAGLHLALRILGVGPGDEVFCSTLTFAAWANAILYVGGRTSLHRQRSRNLEHGLQAPRGDSGRRGPQRGAFSPAARLWSWTPTVSAQTTHPFWVPAPRYEVPVIEDAAEALGAQLPRPSGGHLREPSESSRSTATRSSPPAEGACWYRIDRSGSTKAHFLATQARDYTEDNHYLHSEVGYNYRLSNLLAAVGRAQLRMLDTWINRRRAIFRRYVEALGDLPGLQFMPQGAFRTGYALADLCLDRPRRLRHRARQAVQKALEAQNIESRPVWRPMHMQPVHSRAAVFGPEDSR